jgi:hypothetical protein
MQTQPPRRSSRIEWIPLARISGMIARPTLTALAGILSEEDNTHSHHVATGTARALVVTLSELPELDAVGGIARLDLDGEPPVGIARVGRKSYAAYRPAEIGVGTITTTEPRADLRAIARELGLEGLVELAVVYDEVAGTLTILGDKN